MRFCGIHQWAISPGAPKLLFCLISLKIIVLKLLPHFPGGNVVTMCYLMNGVTTSEVLWYKYALMNWSKCKTIKPHLPTAVMTWTRGSCGIDCSALSRVVWTARVSRRRSYVRLSAAALWPYSGSLRLWMNTARRRQQWRNSNWGSTSSWPSAMSSCMPTRIVSRKRWENID